MARGDYGKLTAKCKFCAGEFSFLMDRFLHEDNCTRGATEMTTQTPNEAAELKLSDEALKLVEKVIYTTKERWLAVGWTRAEQLNRVAIDRLVTYITTLEAANAAKDAEIAAYMNMFSREVDRVTELVRFILPYIGWDTYGSQRIPAPDEDSAKSLPLGTDINQLVFKYIHGSLKPAYSYATLRTKLKAALSPIPGYCVGTATAKDVCHFTLTKPTAERLAELLRKEVENPDWVSVREVSLEKVDYHDGWAQNALAAMEG